MRQREWLADLWPVAVVLFWLGLAAGLVWLVVWMEGREEQDCHHRGGELVTTGWIAVVSKSGTVMVPQQECRISH